MTSRNSKNWSQNVDESWKSKSNGEDNSTIDVIIDKEGHEGPNHHACGDDGVEESFNLSIPGEGSILVDSDVSFKKPFLFNAGSREGEVPWLDQLPLLPVSQRVC